MPKTLAEEVAKLQLPKVAARGVRGDAFNTQTYRQFADQARRLNRDVSFTKDMMDQSFRRAVSVWSKAAAKAHGPERESMITRVSTVCAWRSKPMLILSRSVSAESPRSIGKPEKDPCIGEPSTKE